MKELQSAVDAAMKKIGPVTLVDLNSGWIHSRRCLRRPGSHGTSGSSSGWQAGSCTPPAWRRPSC
jgi:hypothetical protein